MQKKTTTTTEYDSSGKILRKTVVEEETIEHCDYIPVSPIYPWYPTYPNYPVLYTTTTNCLTSCGDAGPDMNTQINMNT